MEKKNPSVSVYKVAAFAAISMILFFAVMKLAGFARIIELRFLNFIIMFFAVRYVLLETRKSKEGKLDYFHGMLAGFMTAFFTSLFYAVFVFLYLSVDHDLMDYLKATQPFGSYLAPASAACVTVVEGIAGGSIIAFAMMHLYNRDNNPG